MSRAQVAALFGVSSSTVARWARASRLPYIRTLGGQRRFPRAPIMALVREVSTGRPVRGFEPLPDGGTGGPRARPRPL